MTLKELYNYVKDSLNKAGADSPAFDAVCLINSVFPFERSNLITDADKNISPELVILVLAATERRAKREPLQYILGNWEFFGHSFSIGEGVLIPRDDTEVVLTCTFPFLDKLSKEREIKILDLCSGSGILAISLKLRYPNSQVTAIELSDLAFPYLEKNCAENKADISLIHGDIFECADCFDDNEFDLIISNPPYVTDEDMENLQSEVRFEPELALRGGKDGCDFYRRIIPMYTKKLRAGGMLAFEYDAQQAQVIEGLMKDAGFKNIRIFDDIGGVHRAINGTLQDK